MRSSKLGPVLRDWVLVPLSALVVVLFITGTLKFGEHHSMMTGCRPVFGYILYWCSQREGLEEGLPPGVPICSCKFQRR